MSLAVWLLVKGFDPDRLREPERSSLSPAFAPS
jgi:hypothetical protein